MNHHHQEVVRGEIHVSDHGHVEVELPFNPEGAGAEFPEVQPHGCGHHHGNQVHLKIVHHHRKIYLRISWQVHAPIQLSWWAARHENRCQRIKNHLKKRLRRK